MGLTLTSKIENSLLTTHELEEIEGTFGPKFRSVL